MRSTWRQGSGQERWFYGAWTGRSTAASAFGPEGWVTVSARDVARRDATLCRAALWLKPFQVPYFELDFLNFSKQNCTNA
jgi:hypothetical protein